MDVLLPLLAFVLLTAANAFFVAAEFSLVTVDRAAVAQQEAAGDRRAARLGHALRSLSFQLSGAQFGITVSALLTGYLAEPAIATLLRPALEALPGGEAFARGVSVGAALAIATLLSMLFGELVPKNAALARPMPIARWAARPQQVFSAIFKPIIVVLNGSANWLVRRLGMEPQEELASARSPEELGLLAAISARAGALSPETATLLQRTIRFGDKRAAEAMTPRVDVVGLEVTASLADLLATSRETGFSRFPVYVDTLDSVIGVASVIDALTVPAARRAATAVRTVASTPVLVPESLDLDGVLDALRESGAEFAVVVDEYGGTDGIVTTEDLIEELVGEIDDEYDPPRVTTAGSADEDGVVRLTAPTGDRALVVAGLLREDELSEQAGFRLPEGPYETLAGFLMARLGHIPVEGETVEHGGWTFTVTAVDRHRIEQVRIRPPSDLPGDAAGPVAADPATVPPLGAPVAPVDPEPREATPVSRTVAPVSDAAAPLPGAAPTPLSGSTPSGGGR